MFIMLVVFAEKIRSNCTSEGAQDAVMTHLVAEQTTCSSSHSSFAKASLAFCALAYIGTFGPRWWWSIRIL